MNTTPYTDDQILEAIEKASAPTEISKFTTAEERLQIGKKFLELLPKPQPILANDGRSLTELRVENHRLEKELAHQLDMGCQAAVCGPKVALDEAIRRMEALSHSEITNAYWQEGDGYENIRARLIAAAKGEERPLMAKNIPGDKCPLCEAEEVESNTPRTTYACGSSDYDGRPGTFHPGDHCNSSGEAKQSEAVADDPYATLKAYAKAGARLRSEDEFGWSEWAANEDWDWCFPPENYQVHPADLHLLGKKRQYFYRNHECKAFDADEPECICWHDEGTGPLAGADSEPTTWRDKPEPKTFTFAELEWNKHTPGDPMPCEPEALVQVVLERELDGRDEWVDETGLAREYDWGVETDDWFLIVGWRYADKPEQHPDTKEMWEQTKKIIEESKAQMKADAQPWTPKPGDVVRLKSGGPKMTVRLPQDESYLCTWTSDYGVFERFFPLACLQQA